MVSLRVSILALLVIGMIASNQQAWALKCYQCDSTTDENCAEEPEKLEPTECKVDVPPTTPEPTTPEPTTPEPTTLEPTTLEPTTPEPTTPEPTTPEPTTPETTTPETTTPKSTTPETTTPETTTPKSTTPETTTPETTTPKSTTPETTTPETTTPKSTTPETTTPEPTTLETTTSQNSGESSGDGNDSNDMENPWNPNVQMIHRFRRNVVSRAGSDFECYKLVFNNGDKKVVKRGCQSKTKTCEKLAEGKDGANCHICAEDGCNSSSRFSIGVMSVLIPVGIVAFFVR